MPFGTSASNRSPPTRYSHCVLVVIKSPSGRMGPLWKLLHLNVSSRWVHSLEIKKRQRGSGGQRCQLSAVAFCASIYAISLLERLIIATTAHPFYFFGVNGNSAIPVFCYDFLSVGWIDFKLLFSIFYYLSRVKEIGRENVLFVV